MFLALDNWLHSFWVWSRLGNVHRILLQPITLLCTSICPYITNMTCTLTSLCIVSKCYIAWHYLYKMWCIIVPHQSLAVLADSMMWLLIESKHSFHTMWAGQFQWIKQDSHGSITLQVSLRKKIANFRSSSGISHCYISDRCTYNLLLLNHSIYIYIATVEYSRN